MDILTDWKFWSLLISIIALLLSQLPPVRLWFRPKRLLVEVHSRIAISHTVGNPNVSMFVSVHNDGGKRLRIEKITISLSRNGGSNSVLPAQNYFQDQASNSTVLFVPFYLKPDESWAYTTNFLNFFNRDTEKQYRESRSLLLEDIQGKLDNKPKGKSKELVVAQTKLVTPFTEMFNKNFIWEPGEYIFELNVKTSPGSASFAQKYRFTIFESDTDQLKSHIEEYKYGKGLLYDINSNPTIILPLLEHVG